ncbi:hypothetical protein B6N60_01419 [Richelia sinica FACHB-800]|uniref:Uncharacterized protein n=1 Tax=Richelia sinica FACHB-800 TaxID=1357546 RepID=A0A975T790_9NOST|nr:hypothetical protein B6N60_01419 [Richelia sinica FACHB-800]
MVNLAYLFEDNVSLLNIIQNLDSATLISWKDFKPSMPIGDKFAVLN